MRIGGGCIRPVTDFLIIHENLRISVDYPLTDDLSLSLVSAPLLRLIRTKVKLE